MAERMNAAARAAAAADADAEKADRNRARYERIVGHIQKIVSELNAELGLPANPMDGANVTFGYIGNLEYGRDDRLWFVFLPHAGRVGLETDRIGGFATGDADGAQRCQVALSAFRHGISWWRQSLREQIVTDKRTPYLH
jgi:hypothetical protein